LKRARLDKLASVTLRLGLRHEVVLGTEIPAVMGTVVAGRLLTSKSSYNKLEDTTGRMTDLRPGDLIAGALGERHALHGYSGVVPSEVLVGDTLQLLNAGGVIGSGEGSVPGLGAPHDVEVLGAVLGFDGLDRTRGVAANIADAALPLAPLVAAPLPASEGSSAGLPPVLVLVGTAMDAGKTTAASAIIAGLTRRGLRVAAGKLTGVSLRRDILQMSDAGADSTCLFTDFGIVTSTADNACATARAILAYLAESEPDLIVLEMGDGLLGPYGVGPILADEVVGPAFTSTVLCAQDPVGVWGAEQLLKEILGRGAALVSGPVSDTPVGRQFCEEKLGLEAHNALLAPDDLVRAALTSLGLDATLEVAGALR